MESRSRRLVREGRREVALVGRPVRSVETDAPHARLRKAAHAPILWAPSYGQHTMVLNAQGGTRLSPHLTPTFFLDLCPGLRSRGEREKRFQGSPGKKPLSYGPQGLGPLGGSAI